MRVSFGPFTFDRENRLLFRDEVEIALPPRVLGVLDVLVSRPGQVVSRQDLLDRVWKDAFVTDTSLAEAVSFLRQALGDDPQAPRYIQTVHRRGYRFLIVPVTAPAEPGSNQGQTGVRPGSDHLRPTFDPASTVAADAGPGAADWGLVPWGAAALCAGLALSAVWYGARQLPAEPPPVARFELRPAPGTTFDTESQPIAVSSDGRSLAWSGCERSSGRCAIYARPIDRLAAERLAGTEGGHSPTFSPDGRWIAFFADGSLKKIAAAGGAATTLASAADPAGAVWGRDNRLTFAPSAASGLSVVGEQGGQSERLTQPVPGHGELRHRFPTRLDGGSPALLLTIATHPDAGVPGTLAALGLDVGGVRTLRNGIHRAEPAGRSYLLLAAGTDLQATTFDERSLVLTGATDSVPAPSGDGAVEFAVGGDILAVVDASAPASLTWSDGADATPFARLRSMTIAPDSRRAAALDAGGDVWVVSLTSTAATRLTFGGDHASPIWSADGTGVVFSSRVSGGAWQVVSRRVSDRDEPVSPVAGAPLQAFPTSAAADGRIALTRYQDGRTAVVVLTPGGSPRVLTDGPYDEGAAVFSPDGRWIAMESSASGRTEVIVRAAGDGRRVSAVSTDGGRRPSWSATGDALYFVSGRRLMKAAFVDRGGPHVGAVETVMDRADDRPLIVTPSGRVLIRHRPGPDSAIVVLHWLRELRARLPLPVSTTK